jgi:hypothetical protein
MALLVRFATLHPTFLAVCAVLQLSDSGDNIGMMQLNLVGAGPKPA